ncbi:hypothetical protein BOKEGFJH_00086 [Chlamydia avium]|uniref:Uncharacterized protein n=1 Tax=Chlamydia avium TaxID=1457141 RepID=A0ABN0MTH6_9CHLA|nr:hypothetical protein [Chlamydia avium]EPP37816.1 hypothetical protein CP10743SC13_0405 [Chlamydia psittaci 10_743_SC13]EPP38743.1 hypothetical protein CP10881SC42_0493 [Chlamydia avium]VVT42577.1 hypothetical protein BOKEGFJH_00086 [Chlamydia avium]
MLYKSLKKIYKNYLKKNIACLIQFLDETLATLGEYFKSRVSKEEQERLLSLLIEDIQQYKKNLQENPMTDPHTNATLLK